ncbi:uncharacterized protein METZ01_LOCUS288260, partial [marine metagenome]
MKPHFWIRAHVFSSMKPWQLPARAGQVIWFISR